LLYEFISLHRVEILARCLSELKDQYPDWQDDELLEGLSPFVDGLAAALARDAGPAGNKTDNGSIEDTIARQHGVIRRRQGFDLSRVVMTMA
jgi:hypothetical protein